MRPLLALVLVSPLLVACGDRQVAETLSPNAIIVDAVHNYGNAHFYFLPPIVGAPTTQGTFDGGLAPVVEICRFVGTCQETIARFESDNGTGGATVDVDVSASRYAVNWDTRSCNWGPCTLDPANTYRINVSAGGVLLGFAEVKVAETGSDLRNVATGEYIGLINGRTLPIHFRIEGGVIARVVITPDPSSVTVGQTTQLTATVLDLHGAPLPVPVTWSSDSPGLAALSDSGVMSGVSPGCTMVRATAGGVTGSAQVAVYGPGGPTVASISREFADVPHLDSLAPTHFPRGGRYSAKVHGTGLCLIRSVTFSDPAVTGHVDRVNDTEVFIVVGSTAVAERDTVHAEIPAVAFTLTDALNNSIHSGAVTFDVVKGPRPAVTFSVLNGVTTVVQGQQTTIEFLATVAAVGNLRFEFVGGPGGSVVFGPISGRYGYQWSRRISITYTPLVLGSLVYVYGNVDGAGRNDQYPAAVTVVSP